MPLTPDVRRLIDQIRDYPFGGRYPDPASDAEQLSFRFFFYLVGGIDAENGARGRRPLSCVGIHAVEKAPVRYLLVPAPFLSPVVGGQASMTTSPAESPEP